jgi:hypothetical protein
VRLRVDARVITEQERVDILAGLGFPELEHECPALPRTPHGYHPAQSLDASTSGLRLALSGLAGVESGGALSLDLHLPGERRVVRLLGDVIWSANQEGELVAGLRIAALEEEGLRRLQRALDGA